MGKLRPGEKRELHGASTGLGAPRTVLFPLLRVTVSGLVSQLAKYEGRRLSQHLGEGDRHSVGD